MTTCPICGTNITEVVDVCPSCHARLKPPTLNTHKPPLKRKQIDLRPKVEPGPAAVKPGQQPFTGQDAKAPGQKEQQQQKIPPAAPGPELSGPQVEKEGTPDQGKTEAGFPGGTPPAGSPYSYPYGYYMPFPIGPYPVQGPGFEDTQAIATRQSVPPPGYQMPFPFVPGWPYPPFMVLPATCYPYAMQQGMYPGYCYPGIGAQYPPAGGGYPPRYAPGGPAYDVPRRKKTSTIAITLVIIVVLLLLAGAGVGVYFFLKPGNSSFDLGSSSVPGEDIELKNMRLDQKNGSAVLTGTYENQSSREGEVVVTVTGVSGGTDTVLSFDVPVESETTDSFTLSEPAQTKLSSATLGPLLFKRSSSSSDDSKDSDSNSSDYPWQDNGSNSDQYNDSSGTVPNDGTIIEEESIDVSPQTNP